MVSFHMHLDLSLIVIFISSKECVILFVNRAGKRTEKRRFNEKMNAFDKMIHPFSKITTLINP